MRIDTQTRSNGQGLLSLVATPIGNFQDMSQRAIETLKECDVIAAEDTRHSARLMQHYDIKTPMIAYHDHSTDRQQAAIIARLREGEHVALISDAGMPVIADPGYRLVNAAFEAGASATVIPGPNAALSALVISGIASDAFTFRGFAPVKGGARSALLEAAIAAKETQILYESCHRIQRTVSDLCALAPARNACIARELTKQYETIYRGPLESLVNLLEENSHDTKGEFVIILAGAPEATGLDETAKGLLEELLKDLPLKRASAICANIFGGGRSEYYEWGLELKKRG